MTVDKIPFQDQDQKAIALWVRAPGSQLFVKWVQSLIAEQEIQALEKWHRNPEDSRSELVAKNHLQAARELRKVLTLMDEVTTGKAELFSVQPRL